MGGHFSWLPSFKGAKNFDLLCPHSRGLKISIFFLPKAAKLQYPLKSEKNNHVLSGKYCVKSISAMEDRVKLVEGFFLGYGHEHSQLIHV